MQQSFADVLNFLAKSVIIEKRQVSDMLKYTTILFDADNTLFDFLRAEREALPEALLQMGVTPTEEMISVYSSINDSYWKRLERGEIDKASLRVQRFVSFCAHYGLSLDAERLAVAYTDALSQKSHLLDGALDVCRALHAHCRLFLVTNGIASVQRGRFTPSPLAAFIEKCYISEELGYEKPSVHYFDAVKADIKDFDAATTLVVGDSLSSDIQGGINAGLDTCWLNRSGKPVPDEMPITYIIERLEELIPLILGD